ncbi:MAG: xanthine dehydrogenase family protein molybdopterin-binding subunit [Chloroflexota bacterium]|nr:MAG: xanthine dehydrogenase family protein molybdopterin-binding subunit [Chloroflexota bacterium]
MTGGSGVGISRPRSDSAVKVTGAIRYVGDRGHPGMLHARLVLATHAHASIRTIDVTAARAAPGVVAVLTAADLGLKPGTDRMALPLARDEVVFAGQPIAVVVAETPVQATDAAELVLVDLEPLPAILDLAAAMDPAAAVVRADMAGSGTEHTAMDAQTHAAVGGAGDESIDAERWSANVVGRTRYRSGDAGAAIAAAPLRVRRRFTTAWVHQGYVEPQGCAAWQDDDGTLIVETSTQGTFSVRKDLGRVLGLPTHRIRVVPAPLGGAFGGKWGLLEPIVAAAALRLARPVQLVLERREDFLVSNPSQAFELDVELAAELDGTFTAIRATILADGGAFADFSADSLAGVLIAGPYRWPNVEISAYGVMTHRVGTGPYRGPSGPPTAFAIESLVDELAGKLAIDPVALRRQNGSRPGDPMVDDEAWVGHALEEVLDVIETRPSWAGRGSLPAGEGIGLSVGYWPGSKDPAAALCRLSPDGSVQVITGVVDMSGTNGAFQAIAAEVLGLPPDAIQVITLDTGSAPPSPGSGGSTVTYSAGRAVRLAAEDARRQLLAAASAELEIDVDDLEIVDGVVRPIGTPGRGLPVAKLVRANDRASRAPIEGHATSAHTSLAPSVAAFIAHVRVDPATGETAVLAFDAIQDVGRALNPALVTGQQHGGAAQAIGWALHESMVHDPGGQLLTATFLDYALPRASHIPPIGTAVVELPAPDGPFGAKGIGEAAVVGGAAAVANAVAAATGIRPLDLPMTPQRIWRALRDHRPTGEPAAPGSRATMRPDAQPDADAHARTRREPGPASGDLGPDR